MISSSIVRSLAPALLLVLLAVAPAAAQTIRGTVVEEGTGEPVLGAFVVLLDADGDQRGGAMTDDRGAFTIEAPTAGTYTLRAERIGYHGATSERITLAEGETVEHRLAVPVRAVSLAAIEVPMERVCDIPPAEAAQVAAAWEEARKALAATAWTQQDERFRLTVREFQRQVDPEEGEVVDEATTVQQGVNRGSPFVSLPPEELAERGYVRDRGEETARFYAPDARVLLSDAFVESHCFRLMPSDPARPGLVGLAFEPERADEEERVDIEGVFWIDLATAELRSLEYAYTGFPDVVADEHAGGRVRFDRLPNGRWIVSDWQINVPAVHEVSEEEVEVIAGRLATTRGRARPKVVAVMESGGSVEQIHDLEGNMLRSRETASLVGTVTDSLADAPLAGATVRVRGTVYRTVADSQGDFQIGNLPGGRYAVEATHPRLREIGTGPLTSEIRLTPGSIHRVDLAVPSLTRFLASRCEADGVRVVGVVRDSASGTPLSEARVDLSWTPESPDDPGRLEVVADAAGHYVACGVPAGEAVLARASFPRRSGRGVLRTPETGGTVRQDLPLTESRLTSLVAVRERTAVEGSGVALAGRVVDDATGEPLPGAQVSVSGTGIGAVAGDDGGFRLDGVPAGSHVLKVEFLGYDAALARLTASRGREISLVARMVPAPVQADPLEAEALANPEDRSRGHTVRRIEAEEIERYPVMGVAELIAMTTPGVEMSVNNALGCVVPVIRVQAPAEGWGGREFPAPLVILEGSPTANACVLNSLNPEDIEEIEIVSALAGAARYGQRGRFGVIRVTIKTQIAQRSEQIDEADEPEEAVEPEQAGEREHVQ